MDESVQTWYTFIYSLYKLATYSKAVWTVERKYHKRAWKKQKKEEDILEYLSKKLGERLVEQSDKYKRNKNLSEFLTK